MLDCIHHVTLTLIWSLHSYFYFSGDPANLVLSYFWISYIFSQSNSPYCLFSWDLLSLYNIFNCYSNQDLQQHGRVNCWLWKWSIASRRPETCTLKVIEPDSAGNANISACQGKKGISYLMSGANEPWSAQGCKWHVLACLLVSLLEFIWAAVKVNLNSLFPDFEFKSVVCLVTLHIAIKVMLHWSVIDCVVILSFFCRHCFHSIMNMDKHK